MLHQHCKSGLVESNPHTCSTSPVCSIIILLALSPPAVFFLRMHSQSGKYLVRYNGEWSEDTPTVSGSSSSPFSRQEQGCTAHHLLASCSQSAGKGRAVQLLCRNAHRVPPKSHEKCCKRIKGVLDPRACLHSHRAMGQSLRTMATRMRGTFCTVRSMEEDGQFTEGALWMDLVETCMRATTRTTKSG